MSEDLKHAWKIVCSVLPCIILFVQAAHLEKLANLARNPSDYLWESAIDIVYKFAQNVGQVLHAVFIFLYSLK